MSEKLEGTSMFRRHRETHRRETEREGIRAFSRPSGRSRLAEANGLGKLVEGLFQGDSNAFGEVFKAASWGGFAQFGMGRLVLDPLRRAIWLDRAAATILGVDSKRALAVNDVRPTGSLMTTGGQERDTVDALKCSWKDAFANACDKEKVIMELVDFLTSHLNTSTLVIKSKPDPLFLHSVCVYSLRISTVPAHSQTYIMGVVEDITRYARAININLLNGKENVLVLKEGKASRIGSPNGVTDFASTPEEGGRMRDAAQKRYLEPSDVRRNSPSPTEKPSSSKATMNIPLARPAQRRTDRQRTKRPRHSENEPVAKKQFDHARGHKRAKKKMLREQSHALPARVLQMITSGDQKLHKSTYLNGIVRAKIPRMPPSVRALPAKVLKTKGKALNVHEGPSPPHNIRRGQYTAEYPTRESTSSKIALKPASSVPVIGSSRSHGGAMRQAIVPGRSYAESDQARFPPRSVSFPFNYHKPPPQHQHIQRLQPLQPPPSPLHSGRLLHYFGRERNGHIPQRKGILREAAEPRLIDLTRARVPECVPRRNVPVTTPPREGDVMRRVSRQLDERAQRIVSRWDAQKK